MGSGAVMLVWSFPPVTDVLSDLYLCVSQSVSFSLNIFLDDSTFQKLHTSTSIHWGYLLNEEVCQSTSYSTTTQALWGGRSQSNRVNWYKYVVESYVGTVGYSTTPYAHRLHDNSFSRQSIWHSADGEHREWYGTKVVQVPGMVQYCRPPVRQTGWKELKTHPRAGLVSGNR
jgi:hypothetical protein